MTNTEKPLVTIIIVTYNSEAEIMGCLKSIFKSHIPVEAYVVDNNSSDSTPQLLKEYALNEPRVHLILNRDNRGLAAANNQPLPYIRTKYTLILNPDILLKEDSLAIMVNAMEEDDKIGMLGPLCLFENGQVHVSAHRRYNLFVILGWRLIPHTLMRYIFDNFSSFQKRDVLFVSGACYIIPSKLYEEINGYDERLFLTISDVADIGMRIRKKGYKAIYYPDAVITHFSGRSNAPLKFLTQYWGLTGDLYFLRKHKGYLQQSIAKLLFIAGSLLRGVVFKALSFLPGRVFNDKARLYLNLTKALLKFSAPEARKD